ncbi:MAG TPA: EAL domain-containing protein, partial [Devosia sp.]
RLAVEITEGVVMDDCPIAMENCRALHAHGVRLSMDDFGTGYSSLSHLARLPVHELKIDRSFMQGLEDSDNARTLVTAVIRIGQSLGLQVVAEGVETDAQRRFLQALDCDVLQGFLFSKALPPDELATWAQSYGAQRDIRGAA